MYSFIRQITEGRLGKTLERVKLSYDLDELNPSMSKDTMEYHYGKLYKTYCDRYNAGEGDPEFNEAGAYLHSIYFSQFREYSTSKPEGAIIDFVTEHFKSWDKFLEAVEKSAMAIQGSGWVYLSKDGEIKTIKNHQIKKDIVILIDWWEHSFQFDYGSDKKSYLNNQWKIIDWDIINARIT